MSEPVRTYGIPDVPAPTAAEAAEADRAALVGGGVPQRVLMENAGRAAALVLHRLFPRGRVVAAVGSGNNGGDALVLLRTLRTWGRDVAAVYSGDREPDPALLHGFPLERLDSSSADSSLARADIVVDGILGTGASGAPRTAAARLIEAMNGSGRPILALDLPSGVDASTGVVPGVAIRAVATVCFGWPKLGLLLQPAREHCGRLITVEIGFPPAAAAFAAALITPAWAAHQLPEREPTAHKNSEGRLLILAGSPAMGGAAVIAAEAAVRAGAGIVRVATASAITPVLQASVPDVLAFDRTDASMLDDSIEKSAALLVGPGLGIDDEARSALRRVLETSALPVVIDADATTILSEDPDRLRELGRSRPVVLTPHPKEMARLTGREISEILSEPVAVARDLADRTGCVVLLKGAPSIVAAPGEPVLINTISSSDAATAGMGDQLAGVIGALLANGMSAREAAAAGLFFSSRALQIAAMGRSLSPRDVSAAMAAAFVDPGPAASDLDLPFVTFDQPQPR